MTDLTRHEARLRIAGRAANVGLWEWDVGTARVVYSDEWKRQLGYEPAEVRDDFAEWESRLHPDDLERMRQLVAEFVARPWPNGEAEFRLRHKDGSWRWIVAHVDMIVDAAGVPVRMIGGNVDVTEQKIDGVAALRGGPGKAEAVEASMQGVARHVAESTQGQTSLRSQLLMSEALLSQEAICVGLLDRDHRFVQVNDCLARNHKKSPDELVGMRLTDLLPEESRPETTRQLDEVLRTRIPLRISNWAYDFVGQPERGRTYWDCITQPIVGESGEVELLAFSSIDVTERVRAEEAVLAREREFRALADNMPDIIVRWDRDLKRLYANPAAGVLAGVPSPKLIGSRLGTPYDTGDNAENLESMRVMHEVIRQAFETGQEATVELVWVTPAGRRVVQGRFVPEFAPDGTIATVLGIARDITALKETQRQLLTLTEHSPDLIMRYDRDGRVLHASGAVERATGIPVSELLGRRLDEWIAPRDGAMAQELLALGREVAQVVATGTAMETEVRVPMRAGEKVFNVRLIPECDDRGRVTSVLNLSRDITASKRAEEALRASEERFREVTENIDEVLWLTDTVRKQIIYVSPAYERVWGRSCESLYASPRSWVEAVHPDDRERVVAADFTLPRSFDLEFRIVRPDGEVRWVRDRSFPIADEHGRIHRVAGVAQDITARRLLEEQLRQSQKMEAIGQLAGGIAHDFNNMLVVVQLRASLLSESENKSELREGVQQILEAAERAANLTRQLLTFSRRDVRRSAQIDLVEVTTGMISLLGRLLGEDISLETRIAPRPPLIMGDPGLMEQLLMNLAVNARDAMPDGGRLLIRLDSVAVDDAHAALHPPAQPGRYLRLAVSDTGCGIAPEHLPRIYEPFFTTKEVGRGTGLGLATVFGIVQQHKGWVEVTSEVNVGTEFRVYLPALDSSAVRTPAEAPAARPVSLLGRETILLVEDDAAVRRLARSVLGRHGYRVLEADSGDSALRLWLAQTAPVDLLLTDLVMPGGMSGHELAQEMLSQQPDLKVVYTSGYSNDLVNQRLHLEPGLNFLPKPYPADELAATVRRCLDSAEG